jgi:quinoprotein glucose dehydrogenase
MRRLAPILVLALASATAACAGVAPRASGVPAAADWPSYGRDAQGSRFSPLSEVDTLTVRRLVVAWTYHTGEDTVRSGNHRSFEATPVVLQGAMYFMTPLARVISLDATTGRERWRHDAQLDRSLGFGDHASRGVSLYVDASRAPGSACRVRVVAATVDARLLSLDAATGHPCTEFGTAGVVDLRTGLRTAPHYAEEYEETSPPAIVGNVVVVGSAIADNGYTEAASGEVRGFDARTGRLLWTWHPVPQDSADVAYASWGGARAHHAGAANTWSVIAADPSRDMVVLPTGSASVDYWGGTRLGANRYANSVVALRASTGVLLWSFQTVHHDLWDYDNASPPALVTVAYGGRMRDAVLQATKTGQLFVLDRDTGEPIVPVSEMPVPASRVAGEEAWPTQPQSAIGPLSPQRLAGSDVRALPPLDSAACVARIVRLRNDGPFTPPSLEGTLVRPSNIGGAHWGGVATDPDAQIAVVPVNTVASMVRLIPRAQFDTMRRETHGRIGGEFAAMRGAPYGMYRELLFTPALVPCSPPPYGELVGVDLRGGRIAWRTPLGVPRGASVALGNANLGGAITTAGGVTFIAATLDPRLRAFETRTGRLLWEARLPAGGKATPMTYAGTDGHQYVVIAAGGDGEVFGNGDAIVAYALPHEVP